MKINRNRKERERENADVCVSISDVHFACVCVCVCLLTNGEMNVCWAVHGIAKIQIGCKRTHQQANTSEHWL